MSSDHISNRPFRLSVASLTDVGLQRRENQDAVVVEQREGGVLLAVFDGMGGHAGGRVASQTAAASFVETLLALPSSGSDALRAAVSAADEALQRAVAQKPELAGMGTTLVCADVVDDAAWIANVGDSRCYLYSGGELNRLTDDHSLVFDMVRRGEITLEEADRHPRKNVITRAIDGTGAAIPDVREIPLRPGDRLLLCSDGLSGMVDNSGIEAVLASDLSAHAMCARLVEVALANGGDDNITVAIAIATSDTGETSQVSIDDPAVTVDPALQPQERRWWHGIGGWGPLALVLAIVAVVVALLWIFWYEPTTRSALESEPRYPTPIDSSAADSSRPRALPSWEQADTSIAQ